MIRFDQREGGAGGVVSLSGLSSSRSLGQVSAVLQGWMGSVAGFPWQTKGVGPAIPAGSFSFTTETQDDPKSQARHTAPVYGPMMNLRADQDPH